MCVCMWRETVGGRVEVAEGAGEDPTRDLTRVCRRITSTNPILIYIIIYISIAMIFSSRRRAPHLIVERHAEHPRRRLVSAVTRQLERRRLHVHAGREQQLDHIDPAA